MTPEIRENMARAIHEKYRMDRIGKAGSDDPSLARWEHLPEYLKESNRQQADDISEKLHRIGCTVRKGIGSHIRQVALTQGEIEIMAEMEHERWNAERLRDGWKLGKTKDVGNKISPYLVGWSELPDDAKEWDREAVRRIPEILAKVGLEVRRGKQEIS